MIIRRRRVHPLGVQQCAVVTAILAPATGMLAGAGAVHLGDNVEGRAPKGRRPGRETLGLRR
jgi:hypothetical protein